MLKHNQLKHCLLSAALSVTVTLEKRKWRLDFETSNATILNLLVNAMILGRLEWSLLF